MTKYYFTRDGKEEEVALEKWRWEATYLDGSVLKQFDKLDEERGEYHQFAEIDQSRLITFRLVNEAGKAVTVLFDPYAQRKGHMKLIHFYRNSIKITRVVDATGEAVKKELQQRNYFFGYELKGRTSLIAITANDEIIMTDDPNRINVEIRTQEVQDVTSNA